MEWEVVATDQSGARKRVKVKASSEASARQKVQNAGYSVVSAKALTPVEAPPPADHGDLAQLAGAVSAKRAPVARPQSYATQPPSPYPPAPMPAATVPAYAPPMRGIVCQTCGSGTMVTRKKHRLSGPAVVIGYIFLIPSLLGILICGIMAVVLFAGGAATASTIANGEVKKQTDAAIKRDLAAAGVPTGIASAVIAETPVSSSQQLSMSPDQRNAVNQAQARLAGEKIAVGLAATGGTLGATAFICVGFAFFVGGLLGWILIMKKKVLQCTHCQAVVAAS